MKKKKLIVLSFIFSLVSFAAIAKADINATTVKEFTDNSVEFYENLASCVQFSENNSKIFGIESDYCYFSRPDTTSYDLRSDKSVNLNVCKVPMSLMSQYSQNSLRVLKYLAKSNSNLDKMKENKKAEIEEIQKEIFEINYKYCK